MMVVLPFNYCYGLSLLHTHLHVGGSVVLNNLFMFPAKVLDELAVRACTGFAGVPSHYQILLRQSSLKRFSFPRLRYVQQAGGHLAPVFVHELRQALPGVDVFIMYGQTEATARLAYLAPEMLDKKLGSIGKAIPGVQLEIVDSVEEVVTLAANEIEPTPDFGAKINTEYLLGMAKVKGAVKTLLDIDRVVALAHLHRE